LHIKTQNHLDITDDELASLTVNWPQLKTIQLSPTRNPTFWSIPPPLSIKSIVSIGNNCPLIESIDVFVSPELKPLKQWLRRKMDAHCLLKLGALNLGDSFVLAPEEKHWVEDLASLLWEIVPATCDVQWHDELDNQELDSDDDVVNAEDPIYQLELKRRRIGVKFDEELLSVRQES
jgi:hypothetical protein